MIEPDNNLAGAVCPKCGETIWRDGTCGCEGFDGHETSGLAVEEGENDDSHK